MELLLNLLWLMLVLPAIVIGRRAPKCDRNSGHLHRSRSLVLLGCLLILLFPVVSATDDLHAMGVEMEEASPTKRMLHVSTGNKSAGWRLDSDSYARIVPVTSSEWADIACGNVVECSLRMPELVSENALACRAPPVSWSLPLCAARVQRDSFTWTLCCSS